MYGACMEKDTHDFIHTYQDLGAYGMDRQTDEETVMFYLQRFSADQFMKAFLPRLSDSDLEGVYLFINQYLKKYLTEDEYHRLFLKDR